MSELIKVCSLCKKYGEQTILRNIDFELHRGEIALIKGRSGTGKSTFLNICSMLEKADSGDIIYEGRGINDLSYSDRQQVIKENIGYIFQDFNLFENLSVFENLFVYMELVSDYDKDKIIDLINKNLSEMGLQSKINDKVRVLSGGEKQRVAMARTLLTDKKILFADEPTANVDDDNAKVMVNIFERLKQRNTGIVIVSHDDIFDEIADSIYFLQGGMLICEK